MPIVAPVHQPNGTLVARPTSTPKPGSLLPYLEEGDVIPIHAGALPDAVNRKPMEAIVLERRHDENSITYIATAHIHQAPFLSLRWDVESGQVADVACWATRHQASLATSALAKTFNSYLGGNNRTTITLTHGSHNGIRRVIGPAWGGTLKRDGDRIRVYVNYQADYIGTVRRYTIGARMLAKHHGVSLSLLNLVNLTEEHAARRAATAPTRDRYILGPRRVNGRYYDAYRRTEYTVVAIARDEYGAARELTVQDADGTVRRLRTPWMSYRDKIIHE